MALSDYSSLEKEIKDAPEPIVLPRGSEVNARIIGHTEGEGDYGKWHLLTFDVPDQPLVKEFRRFISDPLDAQDAPEKTKAGVFRTFRNFTDCFGIDISRPFNWNDDLISLEGWVILGIKKDDEWGDQNTISKFQVRK